MATFAVSHPRERRLAEIDAEVRAAWHEYSAGLRDLSGEEYAQREPAAWDQLQAQLRRLGEERSRI